MALRGLAVPPRAGLRRSACEHSLNSRCATAASRGRYLQFGDLMRPVQTILILALSLLGVWLQFRNIKEDSVLGLDMLDGVPLAALCILTTIFLFSNSLQFRKTKNYLSFIPAFTGLVFIAIIFGHKQWRSSLDSSRTLFTATNNSLGSDGGFIFDFKENNQLKGEKRDHWMVTYYWGRYKKQGDTLLLDIPLNFKMGRHAVLHNDILKFTDDTIHFEVYRQ